MALSEYMNFILPILVPSNFQNFLHFCCVSLQFLHFVLPFSQTMKAHWTMISQIVSLEMMAIKKEPAYFFPRHWWPSCLKRVSPYFKGFRTSRPFSLLGDLTTVFVKKKNVVTSLFGLSCRFFFLRT